MLDPLVILGVLPVSPNGAEPTGGNTVVHQDEERARKLGRGLTVLSLAKTDGPAIVEKLRQDQYDLVILPLSDESPSSLVGAIDERTKYILRHAHCRVFLASAPGIPQEVVDTTPSADLTEPTNGRHTPARSLSWALTSFLRIQNLDVAGMVDRAVPGAAGDRRVELLQMAAAVVDH